MSTDPFAGLSADAPPAAPETAAADPVRVVTVTTKGDIVIDPKAVPYKLEWPIGLDGVEYREVRVHRVTARDRANLVRSAGPRGLVNVRQLVRTVDGKRIPAEVMDGMQWEDGEAIIDIVEPMISKYFPPPPKPATFAGDSHRKTVFLEAAIDYDGKIYDQIEVRRMTAKEIDDHYAVPDAARGLLPCFYDEEGKRVPDEVVSALSAEDAGALGEAMDLFTPRDLKADRAPASTSAPETGETSPQS